MTRKLLPLTVGLAAVGLVLAFLATLSPTSPPVHASAAAQSHPQAVRAEQIASRPASSFVPGILLVKLRPAAARQARARGILLPSLSATGAVKMEPLFSVGQTADRDQRTARQKARAQQIGLNRWYRLRLPADADLPAVLAALHADPSVEVAEADYLGHAAFTPNDPKYPDQWGLTRIGAPTAWDTTQGSPVVSIAVVDTGIDMNHPDLAGQLWTNPGDATVDGNDNDGNGKVDDVHGWDFVNNDNDPQDDIGHGTHVAGIIAAATNNGAGVTGVCPNCRLMAVKVLDSAGQGPYSRIAQGIIYAADKRARVINLSLGGYVDAQVLRDAIAYAAGYSVIIGAAGNDNKQSPFYPAVYDDYVIAVAATDNADHKAAFSNYGDWVDLSAPGVSIWSTVFDDSYAAWSGSSMAAPFVSGVAGLVIAQHSAWSPGAVRGHLLHTADDIGTANPNYVGLLGVGRVNANAAVNTPAQPEVQVEGFAVDGVAGGAPSADSSVVLTVSLTSLWGDATNVTATLATSDPYATVTDNQGTFGTVQAYTTTANSADPFGFSLGSGTPYNHPIPFTLTLSATGDNGPYNVTLPFTVTSESGTETWGTQIISTDTTWVTGKTYNVVGNIRVAEGVTLTIQPGVAVRFAQNVGLRVDGTLIADGTESQPIRFTRGFTGTDPWNPQYWSGINFTAGSVDARYDENGDYAGGSVLRHALVSGGGNGVLVGGASPLISHSRFVSNEMAIALNGGSPHIVYNVIEGNGTGVNSGCCNGGGNGALIEANVIRNNSGQGVNMDNGDQVGWRITGNLIANNGQGLRVNAYSLASRDSPALAYNPTRNEYLALWRVPPYVPGDGSILYAQRIAPDGTPLGSEQVVDRLSNDYTHNDLWLAYDSARDEYLVVWYQSGMSGSSGIYARRISALGWSLGSRITIMPGNTDYLGSPRVAASSLADEYLVTWQQQKSGGGDYDVLGRIVSGDGLPMGDVITVTAGIGNQVEPRVAYNSTDDEYLAVWRDDSQNERLFATRVLTTGVTAGGMVTITTDWNWRYEPALAYNRTRNEYLFTYRRTGSSTTDDVFAYRLLASGVVTGTEITVISDTNLYQSQPQVVYNSTSDEYLVVWREYNQQTGNDYAIAARRIAGDGTPVGGKILISQAANSRDMPRVAANTANGEYLVEWQDYRTGSNAIYGQRLSATGALLDNPGTTAVETDPSVNFLLGTRPGISHNTIVGNGLQRTDAPMYTATGLDISSAFSQPDMLSIHHNNLMNNRPYDAYLEGYGNNPQHHADLSSNYWGTTDAATIDAHIYDCHDLEFGCTPDANTGVITYTPVLTAPDVIAPALLRDLTTSPADPVGTGPVTFTLDFSKPMSPTVAPTVTFGISQTAQVHHVRYGSWISPTRWVGTFEVTMYTGDGTQYVQVSGGVGTDDGIEIPVDTSHTFQIATVGATNVDVVQDYGRVVLSWTASPLETLAGYNVYRSTTSGCCYTKVNSGILSATSYTDTNVSNGTTYYYKVTIVNTDMSERDYSSEVAATPNDYSPPSTPQVWDDGDYTNSTTTLHARWSASDPDSGVAEYQYAIGTSPGGTDVVNWTSAGTNTEVTRNDLFLLDTVTYYFSVKAKNGTNFWSAVGQSDGITVDTSWTPPTPTPTPTPSPPDQDSAHIYLPVVQAGVLPSDRRLEGPSGLEWRIFLPLLGR